MTIVTAERPQEWATAEVHIFADLHLGDPLCDMDSIRERIERCKQTENCVVILDGDLCNTALKTSVSDVYSETMTPMEQVELCISLFQPLADQGKIVGVCEGNHERRISKDDGFSISAIIAKQFKVPYASGSMLIFFRFGKIAAQNHGRRQLYTIFVSHGSGGGASIGGKANRVEKMASIIDADVYVHAHTHEPLIFKQSFFRVDTANSTAKPVERLFINTCASLDYGGYGEIAGFKPSAKSPPVIKLDGTERKMYAQI